MLAARGERLSSFIGRITVTDMLSAAAATPGAPTKTAPSLT
jgi:hypothetical protein